MALGRTADQFPRARIVLVIVDREVGVLPSDRVGGGALVHVDDVVIVLAEVGDAADDHHTNGVLPVFLADRNHFDGYSEHLSNGEEHRVASVTGCMGPGVRPT